MRLTTMSDYAMRLLMYVGQHPGRLCTISEVARAHDISEAHLTKITHQLALAGWLATVRGKGGGMRLAPPTAAGKRCGGAQHRARFQPRGMPGPRQQLPTGRRLAT